MKIYSFLKQQRWIKGPEFLWKSDTEWPEYPANVKEISNDDIETKTAHSTTVEQKDILEHLEISPNGTVWKVVSWLLRLKPRQDHITTQI